MPASDTPERALESLAAALRAEGSVISAQVRDPAPGEAAALGVLAAAGPRAAAAPGAYALVLESVREGYLLHYGKPRLVAAADRDLALLAGDYLYALGLERVAALGDLAAVRELSDLLSLCAQLHGDDGREPARRAQEAATLWLGSATAIATGASNAHESAKASLRGGEPNAAGVLAAAAEQAAAEAGIEARLRLAADSIDFRRPPS